MAATASVIAVIPITIITKDIGFPSSCDVSAGFSPMVFEAIGYHLDLIGGPHAKPGIKSGSRTKFIFLSL